MRVVTYPEKYERKEGDIAVFLAGGISNCDNWQADVIDYLKARQNARHLENLVILNPRGDETKILNFDEKQVWDFDNLNEADIVSFYFCKDAIQSTSMYELGRHLALYECGYHNKIIVSIENGFKKLNVLNDQCQLLGIYPIFMGDINEYRRYATHAEAIIAAYEDAMNDRIVAAFNLHPIKPIDDGEGFDIDYNQYKYLCCDPGEFFKVAPGTAVDKEEYKRRLSK